MAVHGCDAHDQHSKFKFSTLLQPGRIPQSSHQSFLFKSLFILKEFSVLCFYNLGRIISGGETKCQHLNKLQSWKKCSVFVWECFECAIWPNAFLGRSASQKVSEQNCWSQVSVQPSMNWFGFISFTLRLGLVVNICFLCVIRLLKVFQVSLKYCFVPWESHTTGPQIVCPFAAVRKEKQQWKLYFFPEKSTSVAMDNMAGMSSWGYVTQD